MSEIVKLKKILHEGIPATEAIKKLEEISNYLNEQDIGLVINSLDIPSDRSNGLEIGRASITLLFHRLTDPIEFGTRTTK
ncbi:MAG: hypothetical protein IKT97_01525 [Spirochaetia bacterium]|nr:hypothetical protein [Spirochaetia bacterium]